MPEYAVLPSKRKNCRMKRLERRLLAKWRICVIFAFTLAMLVGAPRVSGQNQTQATNNDAEMTETEYSNYESNITFAKEEVYSKIISGFMASFSSQLHDALALNKTLPPGYIGVEWEDTLVLGPKVHTNDWRDLLVEYWLALLWVAVLLILIIVMPLIGFCYCCFCCCQRCPPGCPECDRNADNAMRICCSIILILLLIGVMAGVIIAYISYLSIRQGFESTETTMRRASEDTCLFLTDAHRHIEYLFNTNFEEMKINLYKVLADSDTYILQNITRLFSKAYDPLIELQNVLDNVLTVDKTLQNIRQLIKDLRSYSDELRTGLLVVRNNITFICTFVCEFPQCKVVAEEPHVVHLNATECMYFENFPDTNDYLQTLAEIKKKGMPLIPERGFNRIQAFISTLHDLLGSSKLMRDIDLAGEIFRNESNVMHTNIDKVVSDIQTLENVEDIFGNDTHFINTFILVFMLIIILMFIIALIFALCTPARESETLTFCSRSSGGICLLFCILMIFVAYSILVLISLFYFVMGIVTHQGVCSPVRHLDNNSMLHQVDKQLDLNRYFMEDEDQPHKVHVRHVVKRETEPLRSIHACQAGDSLFKWLQKIEVYDIFELLRRQILRKEEIDTEQLFEKNDLIIQRNISNLRSSSYTDQLCQQITLYSLQKVIDMLLALAENLDRNVFIYSIDSLRASAKTLKHLKDFHVEKIKSIMLQIKRNATVLDRGLQYNDTLFGDNVSKLVTALKDIEEFIKKNAQKSVEKLSDDLGVFVEKEVSRYTKMSVEKCYDEVGKCQPQAYVYNRGVDVICDRQVYPLNGYWIGLQLCILLLLPMIYVAHRLLCLCKKIYPSRGTRIIPCRNCGGGVVLSKAQNDKGLDSAFRVASDITEASTAHRLSSGGDVDVVVEKRSDVALPRTSLASMAPATASYCSKNKQE